MEKWCRQSKSLIDKEEKTELRWAENSAFLRPVAAVAAQQYSHKRTGRLAAQTENKTFEQ